MLYGNVKIGRLLKDENNIHMMIFWAITDQILIIKSINNSLIAIDYFWAILLFDKSVE